MPQAIPPVVQTQNSFNLDPTNSGNHFNNLGNSHKKHSSQVISTVAIPQNLNGDNKISSNQQAHSRLDQSVIQSQFNKGKRMS